jgi:hypothetical protein
MHKFATTASIAVLALLAGACTQSKPGGNETSPAAPAAKTESAPAPVAPSIPSDPRTIAVNVQGVAPVGVTFRVKSVELGTDATTLDVSASYGGTMTNSVELAGNGTYLMNEKGDRLMLKPPQDNQSLQITRGQTMDGKLVFLGAVAPGTKAIKLVINDNNDGNSIISPGLTLSIPLDGASQ